MYHQQAKRSNNRHEIQDDWPNLLGSYTEN